MGLFDIFKKKDCEICGKEVGMFGYKKLEDGEICKDCVKLLSPFFDDRRHSTVEQIKAQIAYREQNAKELESFNHSVVLGRYQKMFIEVINGVPTRFVISHDDDYKEENPDIISFKNISSCNVDIDESKSEEKYTNDKGERVSYNPPRYDYSYNFKIDLVVDNCPYFDDIRIRLNSSTLHLETVEGGKGGILGGIFSPISKFDPMLYPEYREYKSMCDAISAYVSCGQQGIVFSAVDAAASSTPSDAAPQIEKTTTETTDGSWTCTCGKKASGKFCSECGGSKPSTWKCFCGNENVGKFCQNCGSEKIRLEDIECSECSWTAEPQDTEIPFFCPNCGKKFDENDIK